MQNNNYHNKFYFSLVVTENLLFVHPTAHSEKSYFIKFQKGKQFRVHNPKRYFTYQLSLLESHGPGGKDERKAWPVQFIIISKEKMYGSFSIADI